MFSRTLPAALILLLVALPVELPAETDGGENKTPDAAVQETGNTIDFSRDVRPILSDHCFACHGPDENERQADLRLDTAEGIATVIESGDIESSELVRRLHSEDDDERMPPAEFGKPLTRDQIKILESWVAAGGQFQGHWAFERPD